MVDSPSEIARLRSERDLYQRLAVVGRHDEAGKFLEDVLALVLPALGARQGYVEIDVSEELDGSTVAWSAEKLSGDEIVGIRGRLSRGIVERARRSGKLVATVAATEDPRFRDRHSVRDFQLGTVLCAPLGVQSTVGVLYVQDRHDHQPFGPAEEELIAAVARAISPYAERLAAQTQLRRQRDPTATHRSRMRLEPLIGRSRALVRLFDAFGPALGREAPILLCGQEGCGFSTVARVLHNNGPRRQGPFVELGATAPRADELQPRGGFYEAATGGTLVVPSITRVPLEVQEAVLDGANAGAFALIVCSEVDLTPEARQGRVHEALFALLRPNRVRIPGLDERKEDVVLLAERFLGEVIDEFDLRPLCFAPSAVAHLEAKEWLGHVVELRDSVREAARAAHSEGVGEIRDQHIRPQDTPSTSFHEATRRFQRQMLVAALENSGGNVSETARRLDLTRAHVYNLMRSLGVDSARPG